MWSIQSVVPVIYPVHGACDLSSPRCLWSIHSVVPVIYPVHMPVIYPVRGACDLSSTYACDLPTWCLWSIQYICLWSIHVVPVIYPRSVCDLSVRGACDLSSSWCLWSIHLVPVIYPRSVFDLSTWCLSWPLTQKKTGILIFFIWSLKYSTWFSYEKERQKGEEIKMEYPLNLTQQQKYMIIALWIIEHKMLCSALYWMAKIFSHKQGKK